MWITFDTWGRTQYPHKTERDVWRCARCKRMAYVQHDSPLWSFAYAPSCCSSEMEKTRTEIYDGPEDDVTPTSEVPNGRSLDGTWLHADE